MEIDLRFHAPGIALWNTSLTFHEAQHNLAIVHILANGSLTDPAIRQLHLNPFPHPVGSVPLFPRCFPVRSQDRVDELHRRL